MIPSEYLEGTHHVSQEKNNMGTLQKLLIFVSMGLLFSKIPYGILHSVKHTCGYTKKNLGILLGMM
jgi:hypothetical protein